MRMVSKWVVSENYNKNFPNSDFLLSKAKYSRRVCHLNVPYELQQGDTNQYRVALKLVLKKEIKQAKTQFNSTQKDKKWGVSNPDKPGSALAEELNRFYLRFDSHDFNKELTKFKISPVGSQINIECDVWRTLEQRYARKSHGPDRFSGQLLRKCAMFLSCFKLLYYGKNPLWFQ